MWPAVTAAILCSVVMPAAERVPGRDPKKLQVLILTGYNMHDWRNISRALAEMLERTGRFEVRISEEPAGSTEVTFRGYDALVLNYTNYKGRFGPSWPETTRQAFLDFVRSGKGVVAYHPACGAFEEWPEYEKVLGGVWRDKGAHAPYHSFQVDVRERKHPVMDGLPPSFPQIDEIYHGLSFQPGIQVLATAYDDPENCTKGERRTCGTGRHEPMIWTLPYGKGRVFHTILGHDLKSIATAGFVATFVRGTEWAATGQVTIPPPSELRGGQR